MSSEDGDIHDKHKQMCRKTAARESGVLYTILRWVKDRISLTDEDATPVNWKCMFLVFLSMV